MEDVTERVSRSLSVARQLASQPGEPGTSLPLWRQVIDCCGGFAPHPIRHNSTKATYKYGKRLIVSPLCKRVHIDHIQPVMSYRIPPGCCTRAYVVYLPHLA